MELLRFLKRAPAEPVEEGPLYPQVKNAMVDVQAYARSHGGQIHLLGVSEEGDVKIRLTGACNGCPMSDLTLKRGIEDQLKVVVPGVRRVVQVL
jgi:Fe-S cluster biogenesis protein NfuA